MLSNIRYIDQNAFDDDQNTIFAVERGSYAAEWAEKKGYAFEFILTPEEIAYMEKCRREEEARKAEEERLRIEEEERKKREEKERRRKEEERIAARKQAYEQLLGEKKHWQEVFDANKSALFGRSAAARKEAKAKLEKIENKLKGYSDMVGKNGER